MSLSLAAIAASSSSALPRRTQASSPGLARPAGLNNDLSGFGMRSYYQEQEGRPSRLPVLDRQRQIVEGAGVVERTDADEAVREGPVAGRQDGGGHIVEISPDLPGRPVAGDLEPVPGPVGQAEDGA